MTLASNKFLQSADRVRTPSSTQFSLFCHGQSRQSRRPSLGTRVGVNMTDHYGTGGPLWPFSNQSCIKPFVCAIIVWTRSCSYTIAVLVAQYAVHCWNPRILLFSSLLHNYTRPLIFPVTKTALAMSTSSKSRQTVAPASPSTLSLPQGPFSKIVFYINMPLAIACWATTMLNEGGNSIPRLLSPFIMPTVGVATTYFMISMFLLPAIAGWYDF